MNEVHLPGGAGFEGYAQPAGIGISSFTSDNCNYRFGCLTTVAQLKTMESDWLALERAAGGPYGYFQTYDWCIRWCESFAGDRAEWQGPQLRVYGLWQDGSLLMVWPFMATRARTGLRLLTVLTEPLGQYANILADRERVGMEIGREMWHLICLHADVDVVNIDKLPGDCVADNVIGNEGYREKSQRYIQYLDLRKFANWKEYEASLPGKLRKQRRRRRSKLAEKGAVGYEVHLGGSLRYRQAVEEALRMKLSWLKETGRPPGVLALDRTCDFLSGLEGAVNVSSGAPEGAVAHVLTLSGRPVAIELGMAHRGQYHSYLGAFDWNLRKYSPGKIQIETTLQWAKEAGLDQFDFMGDPAGYKSYWTCSSHPISSRSIPLTPRGWFYSFVWRTHLRPLAKTVFNSSPVDRRKLFLHVLGALSDRRRR